MPSAIAANHYCTQFDWGYLSRGLALYQSLSRHAGPFVLHALCFDDPTMKALARLNLAHLHPIPLAEIEQADPELRQVRASRSRMEYYLTCKPSLLLHIFGRSEPNLLTFVDADLFFYASPTPVFREMGSETVLIVEQFPPHADSHLFKGGKYNSGWIAFRRDPRAMECLRWWRERCLEWCYDRKEERRWTDQKYLDEWPARFSGVKPLQDPAVSLAPWNLVYFQVTGRPGAVLVEGRPLICYHFSKLRGINASLFDMGLQGDGIRAWDAVCRGIYAPYVRELQRWMKALGTDCCGGSGRRRKRGLADRLSGGTLVVLGPLTAELRLKRLARAGRFLKGMLK